jgi:hypothetical protein
MYALRPMPFCIFMSSAIISASWSYFLTCVSRWVSALSRSGGGLRWKIYFTPLRHEKVDYFWGRDCGWKFKEKERVAQNLVEYSLGYSPPWNESSEELSVCTANENPIYVFPEKKLCGLSPNFQIHVSVSDLYIPRIGPHIFLQENGPSGMYKSLTDTWIRKLGLRPAITFLGIIVSNFRYCVFAVGPTVKCPRLKHLSSPTVPLLKVAGTKRTKRQRSQPQKVTSQNILYSTETQNIPTSKNYCKPLTICTIAHSTKLSRLG